MTQLDNPVYTATYSLCGGAYFVMEGDDAYENIVQWFVETPPTKSQVEVEIARLQAEHERTEYQRQRATEYPSIGDQLDALWKGGEAAAEMLAKVQAVKNKYPKSE